MSETMLLAQFQELTDEKSDSVCFYYLNSAKYAILNKLYPFHKEKVTQTIPPCYEHKQIEIAVFLYNKAGAEGEISHSENGISRSYENGNIPSSMLKDIVPFAGVV